MLNNHGFPPKKGLSPNERRWRMRRAVAQARELLDCGYTREHAASMAAEHHGLPWADVAEAIGVAVPVLPNAR